LLLTLTSGNDYSVLAMAYTKADLDMANRHVAEAERHILRQEELLTGLRSKAADTTLAEELLAEFHATLRSYREDRDMIAAQLGQQT